MTPDQIDLARVLVMHPRFRWLAPMAAEDGDRVSDVVYPSPAGRTEAEALVAALEVTP